MGKGCQSMKVSPSYVLGSEPDERQRLELQHQLWRPLAQAAWSRAGLKPGAAALDLGCGPGWAARDLAEQVGSSGLVLGLENDIAYLAEAKALATASELAQLSFIRHDLHQAPLALDQAFDLSWCRWVAMFLRDLDPLIAQLELALRPGGVALFHEYIHWSTFGLHPHGAILQRFGTAVLTSFEASGGDANVNRRLPSLLAARGFAIEALRPLATAGGPGSWVARWLEPFVSIYGRRLQAMGLWSAAEAAEAEAAMAAARRDPGSLWVGPTVLEVVARRPAAAT
jgi:SAM-dependent methyltransferase